MTVDPNSLTLYYSFPNVDKYPLIEYVREPGLYSLCFESENNNNDEYAEIVLTALGTLHYSIIYLSDYIRLYVACSNIQMVLEKRA